MKIVVTGGTGFIGSHIIPDLQKKGHEVFNIERYVTGRIADAKICPTYFADLQDAFAINRVMKEVQPEVIIHLAAMSAVAYSYDHPQEVMGSNLIGTVNLAEAGLRKAYNLKQFLFAGTSEEYGNNGIGVQKETDALMPASPYAVSKLACERYLLYLKEAYNFPITILRPFNTFGRKRDTHFLVERTISQMLTQKTVELIDPTPIRDWMYVTDHVNAYLTCIENDKAIGEIFNFCTGKGHSIKETVEIIADLVGFKREIRWGTAPKRPIESKLIIGSYEKAKKILGWSPKYSLEDGLQETIGYWKKKSQ